MARDIMYTCAFGLRFCATHEDVFWSANIRRFFPSAFDDPLWNGILILSAWCALLIHGQAHSMQWCCSFDAWFVVDDSGYVLCRHPRQWTRHGGLQQSFLSYPPPLQDEEDDGGPDPLWAARLSPQNMCVPTTHGCEQRSDFVHSSHDSALSVSVHADAPAVAQSGHWQSPECNARGPARSAPCEPDLHCTGGRQRQSAVVPQQASYMKPTACLLYTSPSPRD